MDHFSFSFEKRYFHSFSPAVDTTIHSRDLPDFAMQQTAIEPSCLVHTLGLRAA